jgi:ribosomal protein S18 acetylase RimI-like enzyme
MTNIRKASLNDVDELHRLGQDVSEFSVNEETVNFWPKATLAHAVQSDDVITLAAEGEGRMVGFIIATYVEGLKKSTIENVFVAPESRGQGVGDALLNGLLDTLAERGCKYVATLIPPDADGASKLYEHAGFAKGETFVWLDKSLSDDFKRTT